MHCLRDFTSAVVRRGAASSELRSCTRCGPGDRGVEQHASRTAKQQRLGEPRKRSRNLMRGTASPLDRTGKRESIDRISLAHVVTVQAGCQRGPWKNS